MESSRRWLIVFAIVLGVLVIATISLVLLVKNNEVTLLPENTPAGTVQRYLMAIQEKDYAAAYGYLSFASPQKVPTYDEWLRTVTVGPPMSDQNTWRATLGETTRNGDYATVEVIIDSVRPRGPFESPLRSQQMAFQLHMSDGKWLITSPTYVYWIY